VGDSDSDVESHVKDSLSELYRMSNPASGNWTMVVTSNSGQAVSYDLQVNSNADSNVMVTVATDQDSYTMNDRVLLTASVRAPASGGSEGQRVIGASVTAEVVFDDQVVDTLQLYDDGQNHHGDDRLNDGVYSNYFTSYVTDGSYTFNVTVVNQTGTTAPPDEEYPGWTPENVDPFRRWGQETVVVDIGNLYVPLVYKNIPVATEAKGKVTDMGASVSGQVLLMRYYNGSAWSTFNTAYTDSNGNYSFPSIPPLGTNQRFYIRWNNSDNGSDSSRVWYWHCDMVDSASASDEYTCNFDLENIDLTSPSSGATMSLPAAFYWQQRVLTSDDYEYNLLDPDDEDPWWWTVPSLGYTYRYILNALPSGFHPGTRYGWFIRVHGSHGYGVSYYYRSIYFSNYGLPVDGGDEPIDRLLPQVDQDEWLIPPPWLEAD
jgi:hypothetical protein